MNYRKKIEQWNKEALDMLKEYTTANKYVIISWALAQTISNLYDNGDLNDEFEAEALYLLKCYWSIK